MRAAAVCGVLAALFLVGAAPGHAVAGDYQKCLSDTLDRHEIDDGTCAAIAEKQAHRAAEKSKEKARRNAEKAKAECDRRGGIVVGMTMKQVTQSCWGAPERRYVTVTAAGHDEQWVYAGGSLYFTGGVLRVIQTTER